MCKLEPVTGRDFYLSALTLKIKNGFHAGEGLCKNPDLLLVRLSIRVLVVYALSWITGYKSSAKTVMNHIQGIHQ